METVAPTLAPTRRIWTPVQRSQAVHYITSILWAVGIQRVFHSIEPAFIYLMGSWGTSIVMTPLLPRPVWRITLATLVAACIITACYWLMRRYG
jgi:hypothetical protein